MNSLFRLYGSLLNKHGRYKIFGKLLKYNQLVQNTATLSLETAHKYFTRLSGVASIQTGISSLSVNSGDIVCDLTLLQDASTTLEQFYATDLGKEIQKGFVPPYSATNTIYEADLSEMSLSGRNLWHRENGFLPKYDYSKDYLRFNPENAVFLKAGTYHFNKICSMQFWKDSVGSDYYLVNEIVSEKSFPFIVWNDRAIQSSDVSGDNWLTLKSDCWITIVGKAEDSYNAQLEIGKVGTSYTPYVKPQKVSILQNGQPLRIGGIGTAKDYYLNASGKVNRALGKVDLGSLNWNMASSGGQFTNTNALSGLAKQPTNVQLKPNLLCSKYEIDTPYNIFRKINEKMISLYPSGTNTWTVAVDNSYSSADSFKTAMSGVYLHYELATPTTEQANSVMLRKGYTKCYDKNYLELEIEVIDPLNFSNKIVSGKNSPTITAEKVITKGFTSGGEHFTQLYIYEDGEIWYVNGSSSAQAFASGVWELEYKQLQFDNKVSLTESERNALLNIYDLL